MMNPNGVTAGEIYGTPTTRMVEGLWDACATFMQQRQALLAQRTTRSQRRELMRAVQPAAAGNDLDRQLGVAVAAEETMPRYLYLNTKQWEQDAPPDLVNFVSLMGLKVLTSRHIPPDTGHLTRDEIHPDEVGKAIKAAMKGERPLPQFA